MRYLVIGTSGAGKSTFAKKLAAATRCPCIELDSHYWGPHWQAVPLEQFESSVVNAIQGADWRTLSRGIARTRLSHGNRESLRMAFFSKDSILLWSLSTYTKNQSKFAALRDHDKFSHLQWTEFTRASQAPVFLKAVAASQGR